ncbi:hypothetical protein [Mucilaginibacter ginsenosidivorax]|uniref:DUF4907 domain-containing protein n=1 Tax=Mucilaginibacter ginsenosidivorax TaxID=862126 RepID=A0A5B8VWZ3_9SPHI|nr:hypothetical protein [Mucilaginibacter ginsenosidivorax]QEC75823.1 hypothetical protein FSB76_07605 [Mucilaginibacter ginsenosidivorax]
MKKTVLTLAIIWMAATGSIAQTKTSNTATWVVESNLNHPGIQTVRFYDSDKHLIYTETIKARINVSNKKVQRKLNSMLDILMTTGKPVNDSNLLAASFKVKKN